MEAHGWRGVSGGIAVSVRCKEVREAGLRATPVEEGLGVSVGEAVAELVESFLIFGGGLG